MSTGLATNFPTNKEGFFLPRGPPTPTIARANAKLFGGINIKPSDKLNKSQKCNTNRLIPRNLTNSRPHKSIKISLVLCSTYVRKFTGLYTQMYKSYKYYKSIFICISEWILPLEGWFYQKWSHIYKEVVSSSFFLVLSASLVFRSSPNNVHSACDYVNNTRDDFQKLVCCPQCHQRLR